MGTFMGVFSAPPSIGSARVYVRPCSGSPVPGAQWEVTPTGQCCLPEALSSQLFREKREVNAMLALHRDTEETGHRRRVHCRLRGQRWRHKEPTFELSFGERMN